MTRVYCITVMVVDHDDLGPAGVKSEIEEANYPNDCIAPRVVEIQEREVEWGDGHPLNGVGWQPKFRRLFGLKERP